MDGWMDGPGGIIKTVRGTLVGRCCVQTDSVCMSACVYTAPFAYSAPLSRDQSIVRQFGRQCAANHMYELPSSPGVSIFFIGPFSGPCDIGATAVAAPQDHRDVLRPLHTLSILSRADAFVRWKDCSEFFTC